MLAGLFRSAVPIFAPHVKAIGKQLLDKGVSHLSQKLSKLTPTQPRRSVKRDRRTSKRVVATKKRRKKDIFE